MTEDDLGLTRRWFDDGETRRFLGGPEWPKRMLTSTIVGTTFRGERQTGSSRSIASRKGVPVGYIDCGIADSWTICEEGTSGPVVKSTVHLPSASIALVVDPLHRGIGNGRAMLGGLMEQPEVSHVRVFGAGVEPANVACVRCFEAAGYVRQTVEPDWEGMLYFTFNRDEHENLRTT